MNTIYSRSWLARRAGELHALMLRSDYCGNDPFDLPNSPLFRWLSVRHHRILIVISKIGSRLPIRWLRPLLRVAPVADPKTLVCAYFGYAASRDAIMRHHAEIAIDCLSALAAHAESGAWWGYQFTWPTRSDGTNPRGASTVVPGAFALVALVHHAVTSGSLRHVELIREALRYYSTEHLKHGEAGPFIGYFATSRHNTYNAGLLGCAAITLGARLVGDESLLELAAECTRSSIAQITDSGYIPYNDHLSGGWTDCFHHLYVIGALEIIAAFNPYVDAVGISRLIVKMKGYYARTFIRDDGLINYHPSGPWPIDPHNYAVTAIYQALLDTERNPSELLARIDERAWLPRRGHYMHRIVRPWLRDRRLFLRWGQSWMFAALSIVDGASEFRRGLRKFTELAPCRQAWIEQLTPTQVIISDADSTLERAV